MTRSFSLSRFLRPLAVLGLTAALGTPALAAQCGGDFNTFIDAMSREAAAQRVSQKTIQSAVAGITHDPATIAFDRRQRGTFRMNFEEYARTRTAPYRIAKGKQMLARHAALLSRIEQQS